MTGAPKPLPGATTITANPGDIKSGKADFIVTKDGVVLPRNAYIPDEFIENTHRSGKYGIEVNKDFIEKLRIDPGTPQGFKGPNNSHFHLNGSGKHIFNLEKWPWIRK